MGKSQRDKGARVERDIAKALCSYFGVPVKRRLGQARDSGEDLTADKLPFTIEIKARADAPAVQKFLEQARDASRDTMKAPIAIVKGDRKPPIVVMYLTDWLELAMPAVQQFEREQSRSNYVPRESRKATP